MKKVHFQKIDLSLCSEGINSDTIINKPGRRSNPVPSRPDEEDEEPVIKPGKDDPSKKKKKKSTYEVTY